MDVTCHIEGETGCIKDRTVIVSSEEEHEFLRIEFGGHRATVRIDELLRAIEAVKKASFR